LLVEKFSVFWVDMAKHLTPSLRVHLFKVIDHLVVGRSADVPLQLFQLIVVTATVNKRGPSFYCFEGTDQALREEVRADRVGSVSFFL
jgi:hypothetical protein